MNFFGYVFGCLSMVWFGSYVVHSLPEGFFDRWYGIPIGVTACAFGFGFAFICSIIAAKWWGSSL